MSWREEREIEKLKYSKGHAVEVQGAGEGQTGILNPIMIAREGFPEVVIFLMKLERWVRINKIKGENV